VILEIAGIGKTSAAAVAQRVISEHKPDIMLYTGVGGALSKELSIGDIGIVSMAIDSEMDARAFNKDLKLGQFPFSSTRVFRCDERLVKLALEHPLNVKTFDAFVATSSQFMDIERKMHFVDIVRPDLGYEQDGKNRLPNVIDMEATGFLTATSQNQVPALIIRSIANTFEGDAPSDLMKFLWDRIDEHLTLVAYILTNLENL